MTKNALLKEVLDWAFHILLAVTVGLLIVNYVAQITIVHGQSMEPTLQDGNVLLIEKISPRLNNLHCGDIVTINIPEKLEHGKENIIKRVIAVENDTIEIKDGKVYVNDKLLQEDYIKGSTLPMESQYAKLTLQKGYIFVLGDNRMFSKDSRIIGPIDIKRVSGKVLMRFFPFGKMSIF